MFLGNPEVHHAGQALKFPTRKTLALLTYLAVAEGMQSRETLTALFWPESNAEQGRAALRNTLTYLRNILDDRVGPHLVIEREALGFDFHSDFDLDLKAVATAVQMIRTRSEQIAPLQMAIQRYRGDFLAGFSLSDAPEFDQWASLQREYWHQQVSLVGERLSAWQTAAGDVAGAMDTLTHWLKLDPLNELVYQRLMQLHLAAGDRESARHTYETCRAMLAAEFGVEPTPETAILAQQLSAQKLPRRLTISSSAAPRYLDIPLVGRSPDYLKLIEIYHRVRRSGAHLVSLEGEAGIGKTRLASEFLTWAAAEGADVVRGRAFETGGRLPYQPIAEAWRNRLERENAPDDLLADIWLAELSRLLPELRERYPDLPAPIGDEAAARTRLFEAVTRLGLALASRNPLILFIDDVQWADVASLDLLHYAARRWAESITPVLLLVNVRAEALLAGSELTSWLVGLKRDCPLTRLTLNPLTVEDTQQLVHGLAEETNESQRASTDSSLVEAFGRWLFIETSGQPFFITETIKSLLERSLLSLHDQADGRLALHVPATVLERSNVLGSGSMPPGVRDVIRARLGQLRPNALAMLAAGAVLGQNFTFERLCQVADLSESEGLPALDELLAPRLLMTADRRLATGDESFASAVIGPSSIDIYVFTHDKIRDVAYTEAGDARRRILHRRALAALEASDALPAELAHHALRGRQVEAAFQYSLAAGDAALKLFAIHDAIAHYEQARQAGTELHARSEKETSLRDWQHLFLQLGRAYELNSQMEQARTIYQAMLTLAREARQAEMECNALNRLATLAAQDNYDLEAAAHLLKQALSIAEVSGDKVGLVETEWNLAQMAFYAWDAPASLTHGERALTLARELGLQELVARSLNAIAYAEASLGQWIEAEVHAEEAVALYGALGNRAMEADCLGQVTEARISRGRPQEGISAGRVAYAISLEIENAWGQVTGAINLTPGLLDIGAYAEALAIAQQGVATARTLGMPQVLVFSLMQLGAVYRALLALEAACATHLEAMTLNETMSSPPFTEMIAAELYADYALAGNWVEAYAYALRALAVRNYTSLYGGLTRWYETEALLRSGEVERAIEDVRRFGEQVGDNPRYRIPYMRALAVLSQWEGNNDQAVAHLEAANALAEAIGLPGEQWQILAALGELYQSRGEYPIGQSVASPWDREARAREVLRQTAKIVQALAAKIDDEGLRARFLAAEPVRRVMKQLKVGAE